MLNLLKRIRKPKTLSSLFIAFKISVPETKIAEFANSVDLDEVAHDEPPRLDLHCLPSRFCVVIKIKLRLNFFLKFSDENFVVCFLVVKVKEHF